MEYVQLTLDDWLREKEALREDLNSTVAAFVRIGYRLRKIRDGKLYEQDGCKSITEFAKKEYGLEKSTTSTFIAINENFSKNGFSMELQDRYKGMGSSVLAEMLKLSESDRELITQDSTRAQIRELKQFNKTEPAEENSLTNVIIEFFRNRQEMLNEFYSSEAYTTGDMEELVDIINPSGNMTFRNGRYMLFFYDLDKGIKYKIFGDNENHQMNYGEFFSNMQDIFQNHICGNKTHQAFYGEPEVKTEVVETTTVKTTTAVTPQKPVETKKAPEQTVEKTPKQESETEEKQLETVPPAKQQAIVNTMRDEVFEMPKIDHQEQIPGQQEITEYKEVIPDGVIIEPTPKKQWNRKEYLDNCTEYGAAVYMYRWFKDDPEAKDTLNDLNKMERWMKEKVDVNGQSE